MIAKNVNLLIALSVLLPAVVQAAPGEGIRLSNFTLSPYAGAAATYDSNIYSTPSDETDDTYFDIAAGLKAGYQAKDLLADSVFFFGERAHVNETDENFSSAGELITLTYGDRDRLEVRVGESFRRVEDLDPVRLGGVAIGGISSDALLDSSSQERRDVGQVALGVGRNLTDKIDMDLGYRYDDVDYKDDALSRITGHAVSAEGGMNVTDKTAATLTGIYGIQSTEDVPGDNNSIAARVGAKTRGTAKVTFKGGLGVLYFDRAPGGDSDNETLPNYDLLANWRATSKVNVNLGGANGIQSSSLYANNPAEFNMVWLSGSYLMMPAATLTAGVTYRTDAYLDDVMINGVMADRTDDGFSGSLRLDVEPRGLKFVELFTEARYQTVESDVSPYDDARISVGANIRY